MESLDSQLSRFSVTRETPLLIKELEQLMLSLMLLSRLSDRKSKEERVEAERFVLFSIHLYNLLNP
jgi:hypothetical protein